ncbi:hypothetical protein J6590_019403 [Homalodisca vitripennis]|nr:hypothetical protein J6590_019403 [Homalodisca vitripennis]
MWPLARGSLQPVNVSIECPKPLKKTLSAPQLSPETFKVPVSKLSLFAEPLAIGYKPAYCSPKDLLLSHSQLISLDPLPQERAVSIISDWLKPQPAPLSLALLLFSVYRWATGQGFQLDQTSVLITILHHTYRYAVQSPWRTQLEVYSFFKESLLLNSVQHLPGSAQVFKPDQCKTVLLQFCRTCLTTLPLLRLSVLPNYRLTLSWDVPKEEVQVQSLLL